MLDQIKTNVTIMTAVIATAIIVRLLFGALTQGVPWARAQPVPTRMVVATATPTITPTPVIALNQIPLNALVVMPDEVQTHVHTVYVRGQARGHNPRAFSKIGDSTIEDPFFLTRFDTGSYNLGQYAHLQDTIDYFTGSFGRDSAAVRVGFHAWTIMDPAWADKARCEPNETPIACEFRLHNPSFVIIRLGANDTDVPDYFERTLRQAVEYALEADVIPILGTKPDPFDGSDAINDRIRRIAADYQIPLWDYAQVARTIPSRGLGDDQIHMTSFFSHDYTDPQALQYGHSVHNLTALMLLDVVVEGVVK